MECHLCSDSFEGPWPLRMHLAEEHFHCAPCQRSFSSRNSIHDHQSHSQRHPFYCSPCMRDFANLNSLRMHLRSSAHLPRDVPCFNCCSKFVCVSGLLIHIEYQKCFDLSGRSLLEALRKWERIMDQPYLFTASKTNDTREFYQPDGCGKPFLCDTCSRRFVSMDSLQQHLNFSTVHKTLDFHCKWCHSDFALFSSLVAHLESGSCDSPMYPSKIKKLVLSFTRYLKENFTECDSLEDYIF